MTQLSLSNMASIFLHFTQRRIIRKITSWSILFVEGLYIIEEQIIKHENQCGYCCEVCGNEVSISKTSQTKDKKYAKPKSSCVYFVSFNLGSAHKSTVNSPCTNRPIVCGQGNCDRVILSYNFELHCRNAHFLLIIQKVELSQPQPSLFANRNQSPPYEFRIRVLFNQNQLQLYISNRYECNSWRKRE